MHPVALAALGGLYTWGMTALGSATVFFFKSINRKLLSGMLGFASGVMLAASFWSLLAPAVELGGAWAAVGGFLLGGGFLYLADRLLPHLHSIPGAQPEGIHSGWRRSVLLVLAITLHNIPEGLAFGVAFGSAAADPSVGAAALALTAGIGVQNFPEGAAVSIPLRREGLGRFKSFMYGQLSGVVEPIAAVLGALLAVSMTSILPWALAFAAGAMVFVVAEELIPEASASSEGGHHATIGVLLGFVVMMALDTLLG